jgi:putative peptidoglycan lipid II flippase
MQQKRNIIKSAFFVSIATSLSRVAGYVRDLSLAIVLGAGFGMDAFTVGYRIANLFRSLVGEGAMNACFVPVFVHYQKDHSAAELWDFVRKFFYSFFIVLLVLALLIILFSPFLIRLMAPGFAEVPGKLPLTVFLNRLMAPYLICIGFSALFIGILNSLRVFFLPASTSTFFNLAMIATAFLVAPLFKQPATAMAIGVLIGGTLQWVTLLPSVIKRGMSFRPTLHIYHPESLQVLKLLIPILFGISIAQINLLVGSIFASFLEQGSVSSLYYADRVMELMLGIFAISFATVILPELSRAARDKNYEHGSATLNLALRITLFIAIPATAALLVLNQEIIFTLFKYGRFTYEDGARTSYTLFFLALSLTFFSVIKVIIPSFYAFKDTKTPVWGACIALVSNILFILIFIKPLKVGGIALAISLGSLANLIFLIWKLREKHFRIRYSELLPTFLRVLAASGMMAASCRLVIQGMGFDPQGSLLARAFPLAAAIVIGFLVYCGTSVLIRTPEMGELIRFIREKTKKKEAV